MATARSTVGSLFQSVGKAADTVTATLDAATAGIGMINAYVNDQAEAQRIRILIDRKRRATQLIEEAALEEAQRAEKIRSQIAKSPEFEKDFNDSLATFHALVYPDA